MQPSTKKKNRPLTYPLIFSPPNPPTRRKSQDCKTSRYVCERERGHAGRRVAHGPRPQTGRYRFPSADLRLRSNPLPTNYHGPARSRTCSFFFGRERLTTRDAFACVVSAHTPVYLDDPMASIHQHFHLQKSQRSGRSKRHTNTSTRLKKTRPKNQIKKLPFCFPPFPSQSDHVPLPMVNSCSYNYQLPDGWMDCLPSIHLDPNANLSYHSCFTLEENKKKKCPHNARGGTNTHTRVHPAPALPHSV